MNLGNGSVTTRIAVHAAVAAAVVLSIAACGGGSDAASDATGANQISKSNSDAPGATSATVSGKSGAAGTSAIPASTAPSIGVPTGRLLASNCFQCHGTNGVSSGGFDRLAGQSAREIADEMKEMSARVDKGIMHVQALGYTDQQIWQLATYFSNQR